MLGSVRERRRRELRERRSQHVSWAPTITFEHTEGTSPLGNGDGDVMARIIPCSAKYMQKTFVTNKSLDLGKLPFAYGRWESQLSELWMGILGWSV